MCLSLCLDCFDVVELLNYIKNKWVLSILFKPHNNTHAFFVIREEVVAFFYRSFESRLLRAARASRGFNMFEVDVWVWPIVCSPLGPGII